MATLYRHGTKPPVFRVSIVPPRVTYIDMPSIGLSIEALAAIPAGYPERQETPWNASGIASPRFGHLSRFGTSNARVTSRSRHAASRGVTHGLGSVQALPWSCFITDDSVKAHGSHARIVHASFTTGGLGTLQTGKLSTAGRSPNFPHPQLTGRPWLMTSGGVENAWRALIFLDRPLNSRSINVQKKGSGYFHKGVEITQQNPLGFHGGSHG